MKKAPTSPKENQRLEVLKKMGILNTAPEEQFDRITQTAVKELKVPISTISIIDENREWFKSCQGLNVSEDKRETSFCGHALFNKGILVVEDTQRDERFKDNPHVTKEGIRFYAGIALYDKESRLPMAVFCVKDFKPRIFSVQETAKFMELAKQAEMEFNKK
ncbi:MAG: GAF domain-containing protein [Candidatus Buchananbacteria bacterium]|nr:GAF domain-containing protein [Candidatus Buchananbacteria bacterium]